MTRPPWAQHPLQQDNCQHSFFVALTIKAYAEPPTSVFVKRKQAQLE